MSDALDRAAAVARAPGVAALLGAVGGTRTDFGVNVIVDAPSLEGIARLNVMRAGEDTIAALDVTFSEPLAAADLAGRLGEPRRNRGDKGPDELLYPGRLDGFDVIASDERGVVRTLTLRPSAAAAN